MRDALFYLDRSSELSLRQQIRQKLVEGISTGAFPAGTRLPSSRKLAQQLNVSRNTVVSVYQDLIADGYIVSRQRSGIFVDDDVAERHAKRPAGGSDSATSLLVWRNRIKYRRVSSANVDAIPNWNDYPYPFLDGKFDPSLFPLAEWREANKLTLGVAAVEEWSTGDGDADDATLIHEIRTKFLTRRGIQAGNDEVLLTLGTQNSLYIIARLLADATATVGIEEPGNFRMRGLLEARGANVRPLAIDDNGMRVSAELGACDWIYVTPSHQIPTAVAMPMQRRRKLVDAAARHDCLIVEDDYECELNYEDQPQPALRSIDTEGRVIYVAELSKVLAPGIGLGFIVANAAFIRRARELRRTLFTHPPLHNQRAAAYFLSLGFYDSMMMRLSKTLRERRLELRDALSNMRGVPLEISPEVGGTTYWVRTPPHFNVAFFVQEAAEHGILLEPVADYYLDPTRSENCFRMGVTSVPQERIVPGVRRLVELIRRLVRGQVEQLDSAVGEWLRGDDLERVMSGATVRYQEVYGTVCTIELHPDGRMSGDMGEAAQDTDTGTWRVEGDLFFRRWDRWNYAAEAAYYIVVDGETVKYFNEDRQIVDSATIQTAE
ncbi:MAG: PLP-dependent aminotransferase family protein [Pseudomonadota bacterium]